MCVVLVVDVPAFAQEPPSKAVDVAALHTGIPDQSSSEGEEAGIYRGNTFWTYDFLKKTIGGTNEIPVFAEGSDEEQAKRLSLDMAVMLAIENNYELKAAIEEGKSRYWDKLGAYGQYLPAVSLDLSVGHERSRPAAYNNENGDRVSNDRHLRRDRALLVKQPIFDLTVISDIISTTHKEDLAKFDLIETRNTVASETIQAYLKLMQSHVFLQLAANYQVQLDVLSGIMKARVDAGGGISADVDRILSRSGIAETAKVEANADYDVAVSEFKRLTGVVPSVLVLPEILVPDVPEEIEMAFERAYQNNPNYLASVKKIDLAQSDRNKAASALAPKVYAQVSKDYTYNPGGAANGNPVDGVYPSQRTDKAMVVAQWSLYGGTAITGALSGQAKQKEMYYLSHDIRDKMDQALKMNYTAIKAARERIEVLRESVEANERVVKGFEEQFNAGTRSLFELLDAYEQAYNARLNLTRAIFANSQAAFQVLQQTGDIVNAVAVADGED